MNNTLCLLGIADGGQKRVIDIVFGTIRPIQNLTWVNRNYHTKM